MKNVRANVLHLVSEMILWGFICAGLFVFVFPFDEQLLRFIGGLQTPWLNQMSVLFTEYLLYLFLGIVYARMVWQWLKHRQSRFMATNVSVLLAVFIGFVLKQYFEVPRPFVQYQDLEPVVHAGFYSFPSNHTTLVFAAIFPLWRLCKWWGLGWSWFAILTAFFRVYQNVHFPTDIVGGMLIGGGVGLVISHPFVMEAFRVGWKSKEFRRQFVHFWFGMSGLVVYWMFREHTIMILSAVLAGGLTLSLLVKRFYIPLISDGLDLFERSKDRKEFPGRGPLWFLCGMILAFWLFPPRIAFAAILILSAGDSFNHFFNRQPHHTPLPWNAKKNWYGLFFGTFMGAVFASFFIPFWAVLVASLVAITLESFPVRIAHLYMNDNVLVPLVSGGILLLLV